MSIEVIRNRIKSYSPRSIQEEENAIKEIYQEIALSGLSRQGFFKLAGFQGGTCLRIIHQLNRFSEDLDFILLRPDKTFVWDAYLKGLEEEFAMYGVNLQVLSPSRMDQTIQRAVLKDSSFLKVLQLDYERNRSNKQTISIKFELDVNPPKASNFETHILDFPLPFSVVTQDQTSLFASKCHALLCRKFVKGRDWYDFLWYVGNQISINYEHLKYALMQTGHWPYEPCKMMDKKYLIELLSKKVRSIDWDAAASDVNPLLKPIDRDMLREWTEEFFLSYVEKLNGYLKGVVKQSVIFRISGGPAPKMDNRLFLGAISSFDQDEIARIQESETFWCQPLDQIDALEDTRDYKVVFFHLDYPGTQKGMGGKTKWGGMKMREYFPGNIYDLPGWFIKNWNSRRLLHHYQLYRTLYWFQPLDLTPPEIVKKMKSHACLNRDR